MGSINYSGLNWDMFPEDVYSAVTQHDRLLKCPPAVQNLIEDHFPPVVRENPAGIHGDVVVLLSGGLDSAVVIHVVAMAILRQLGVCDKCVSHRSTPKIHCLTFNYNQRHRREIDYTTWHAQKFHASLCEIKIDRGTWGAYTRARVESSALIHSPDPAIVQPKISMQQAYVPGRNLLFLAHATSYAETVGARHIFYGANNANYGGYPDCQQGFIDALEDCVYMGTKKGVEAKELGGLQHSIRIHAPLINMSKIDIIQTGIFLGVDFVKTHSCHRPSKDGHSCGICDACVIRLKSFELVGIPDPIAYTAPPIVYRDNPKTEEDS